MFAKQKRPRGSNKHDLGRLRWKAWRVQETRLEVPLAKLTDKEPCLAAPGFIPRELCSSGLAQSERWSPNSDTMCPWRRTTGCSQIWRVGKEINPALLEGAVVLRKSQRKCKKNFPGKHNTTKSLAHVKICSTREIYISKFPLLSKYFFNYMSGIWGHKTVPPNSTCIFPIQLILFGNMLIHISVGIPQHILGCS